MRTTQGKAGWSVSIVMILTHAALWLAILLYLVLFVPGLKRTFLDFAMRLPEATEWMIAVSDWVLSYWYVLPFFLVPLLAADGAVILLLRLGTGRSWPSWIWFSLITLLTVIIMVVLGLASLLPMIKLQEGLSK